MDSGLRRNDGADAFAMQQKVFCKGLGLRPLQNIPARRTRAGGCPVQSKALPVWHASEIFIYKIKWLLSHSIAVV
ncbi:MAG: hypothetical protein Q4G28_03470 [Neisseria sp.]|nr:hypothetical protein [Neisseria sp.]